MQIDTSELDEAEYGNGLSKAGNRSRLAAVNFQSMRRILWPRSTRGLMSISNSIASILFHGKLLRNNSQWSVAVLAAKIPDKLAFLRAIVVRILFHKRRDREGGKLRGKFTEAFILLNRIPAFAKILGNPDAHRLLDPSSFGTLASELLRSDLPFLESDLVSLIDVVADQFINLYFYEYLSPDGILHALEQRMAMGGSSPLIREKLQLWQLKIMDQKRVSSKSRKLITRINGLLGMGDNPGIEAGEAWSDASLADLKPMPSEQLLHWCSLLQHCQTARIFQTHKKMDDRRQPKA